MRKRQELLVEEALSDSWAEGFGIREVPLAGKTFSILGAVIFLFGALVLGRVAVIASGFSRYAQSAAGNLAERRVIAPPRGIVYDRNGIVLAENTPSFLLFLDADKMDGNPALQEEVLGAVEESLGIPAAEVRERTHEAEREGRPGSGRILLSSDISESELIEIQSRNLPPLSIEKGFRRRYPQGSVFSSVLGYTGAASAEDLKRNPLFDAQATLGKSGIEAFYDEALRGTPGEWAEFRNAKGESLGARKEREPATGESLTLTIDAEFQEYFFRRFEDALAALGRTKGVGIALDPRNGEVLALFNFPAFDGNAFSLSARNAERKTILSSPDRPLFNRAVSGFYNPGSTIKPLVGVAALAEGVVQPAYKIFSPGYLEIPNRYDPEHPTRYPDWRPQGWVDLSSAIAQSSNVYFYAVGGGSGGVRGLGISRLHEWWETFGLGKQTGIDLPFEAEGFLPTAAHKKEKENREWLLGDTYNVSIGQGDLLVTPLQLINYIAAIANGGKIFRPFVNAAKDPEEIADLSEFILELKEAEQGMIEAVTEPRGTANLLSSLPFRVAGKTGSAQVENNTQENAFFVGYGPVESGAPEIAVLVLVESSREGSLNAVPIARDVLEWYYEHRIKRNA